MSVLIEAISVVMRLDSVEAKYPGGVDALAAGCPNRTFCRDDHLARVGFMHPQDAREYVEALERNGLVYVRDGQAVDLMVVDQNDGPMLPSDWLECFRSDVDGHPVSLCCLRGTSDGSFRAPPGWRPGDSGSLRFVPKEKTEEQLTFVRHDGNIDVLRDNTTGHLEYVGRTGRRRTFRDYLGRVRDSFRRDDA